MSRFSESLRIIPRIAWYLAICAYIGFSTMAITVFIPQDRVLRNWPLAGKLAFAYGTALIFVPWILLIGYIYADAKRRGMRYVLWTWLAILVPHAIGIILYFVLQDPLSRPCPQCAALVRESYVFCPSCGTAMQPTCPNCRRGVEPGWSNCPHCGGKLPSPAPRTA